jgi:chorismate mutase
LNYCRGIRGAITVQKNTEEEISVATKELLGHLVRENDLHLEDIVSALFTMTDDLNACFPAQAAREIGWTDVPLMCMREIPVPGSLGMCIRVLLHVNTTRSNTEVRHVYLRDAIKLRPRYALDD